MRLGVENPRKVSNIVFGNLPHFRSIFAPALKLEVEAGRLRRGASSNMFSVSVLQYDVFVPLLHLFLANVFSFVLTACYRRCHICVSGRVSAQSNQKHCVQLEPRPR